MYFIAFIEKGAVRIELRPLFFRNKRRRKGEARTALRPDSLANIAPASCFDCQGQAPGGVPSETLTAGTWCSLATEPERKAVPGEC